MTNNYHDEAVIKKIERWKNNARNTIPKARHGQMPEEMWERFDYGYPREDGLVYERSIPHLFRALDGYQGGVGEVVEVSLRCFLLACECVLCI